MHMRLFFFFFGTLANLS